MDRASVFVLLGVIAGASAAACQPASSRADGARVERESAACGAPEGCGDGDGDGEEADGTDDAVVDDDAPAAIRAVTYVDDDGHQYFDLKAAGADTEAASLDLSPYGGPSKRVLFILKTRCLACHSYRAPRTFMSNGRTYTIAYRTMNKLSLAFYSPSVGVGWQYDDTDGDRYENQADVWRNIATAVTNGTMPAVQGADMGAGRLAAAEMDPLVAWVRAQATKFADTATVRIARDAGGRESLPRFADAP